jgi:hypothetical protein
MLLYAGTHGCEELSSGKCGCLLMAVMPHHQAVVVNDAIVQHPLSIVIELELGLLHLQSSINQFRRHGPIWAFAISWLNLLWWRVRINLVNLLVIYLFTSKRV